MSAGVALITLHNGTCLHIPCDADADLDELTRFVDLWQSGVRGRATINARRRDGSVISKSFGYRDVLRVDFPESGSCGCEVTS